MCHILLALPILALPVFWLLPLAEALPIYAVVAVVSVIVYAMVFVAMRKPVATGIEELVRARGQVDGPAVSDTVWVRVHGERWRARSAAGSLAPGARIRVTGIDGMVLKVEPDSTDPA